MNFDFLGKSREEVFSQKKKESTAFKNDDDDIPRKDSNIDN